MKGAWFICAALLLTACTPPPVDLRSTLTRRQLDTVTTPLLLTEVEDLATQATLIPWGENGDVVTWRTGDGVSLAFAEGVLTATRGLGADLMSADVRGTRRALSGGTRNSYERFLSFVDGESQTVFRTMICSMSAPVAAQIVNIGLGVETYRYEERCRSTTDDVTNIYWLGADGTMWRARQWVGPGAGYLVTERLVR